jgi:hypothetical protein
VPGSQVGGVPCPIGSPSNCPLPCFETRRFRLCELIAVCRSPRIPLSSFIPSTKPHPNNLPSFIPRPHTFGRTGLLSPTSWLSGEHIHRPIKLYIFVSLFSLPGSAAAWPGAYGHSLRNQPPLNTHFQSRFLQLALSTTCCASGTRLRPESPTRRLPCLPTVARFFQLYSHQTIHACVIQNTDRKYVIQGALRQ